VRYRTLDGRVGPEVHTTAPWVAAVDQLCQSVRRGSRSDLADPRSMELALESLGQSHVLLRDVTADPDSGTATVTITPDGEKLYLFHMRRLGASDWKVERVSAPRQSPETAPAASSRSHPAGRPRS
jgi:hypothetical protein